MPFFQRNRLGTPFKKNKMCSYKPNTKSLCRKFFVNQSKLATSLQAIPRCEISKKFVFVHRKDVSEKRVSHIISLQSKGSITLEASIAIPIFLFFVVSLLSIIPIIGFQSNLQAAMHQTAREVAMYGYAYDKISEDKVEFNGITSAIWTNLSVKNKVIKAYGVDYWNHLPISLEKLSFSKTSIMEDEQIDLVVTYSAKPLMNLMPISGIPLVNRCRVRAWTGYDNAKQNPDADEWETYVYITDSGTVYHLTGNCSHLDLSIEGIPVSEVEALRNGNGGKYYLCELCGKKNPESQVYLTGYGDRYHYNLSCSGLKRTIKEIPLSKVGNRKACSRCGGTN